MIKITSKQTVNNIIKIYFDNKLHLLFNNKKINGLQSWIENEGKYVIEINMIKGESIILEYNEKEKWEEILKCLDDLI